MDGKGRYQDNIFVERLWRTVKYEEVYLKAYASVLEAQKGLETTSEPPRVLKTKEGREIAPHGSADGLDQPD